MQRPPCPPPGAFDEQYFKTYYRDYIAQNPPRRLRFYAQTIERHLAPGAPRRVHDIGCAFGRFLGSLDPTWQIFGTDVSEKAVEKARAGIYSDNALRDLSEEIRHKYFVKLERESR